MLGWVHGHVCLSAQAMALEFLELPLHPDTPLPRLACPRPLSLLSMASWWLQGPSLCLFRAREVLPPPRTGPWPGCHGALLQPEAQSQWDPEQHLASGPGRFPSPRLHLCRYEEVPSVRILRSAGASEDTVETRAIRRFP